MLLDLVSPWLEGKRGGPNQASEGAKKNGISAEARAQHHIADSMQIEV